MPSSEAPTLYTTMENSAAHRAMSAAFDVAAEIDHVADGGGHGGVELRHDEDAEELKMAAMMTAERTRMHRVVTRVAMALGASVQPLTKMTPSVSNVCDSQSRVGKHLLEEMRQ